MADEPDEQRVQDTDLGEDGGPSAESPGPPTQVRYSRRWFLMLAGVIAAGLVGAFEAFHRFAGSGGGSRAGGLSGMFGSFPVRSVENVPGVAATDWVIKVDGLVERPLSIGAAQWRALERLSEDVNFHCVEGWSVDHVRWAGVAPAVLLKQAGARPDGQYVNFHAYGGEYVDSLPLSLVLHPQTVLADTLDGQPLPADHGGPVRLVVPVQLGYKSVKWVTRIEVTDTAARGYWEQRGYPSDAPVRG
jgi:methionine sulfoxide reductase catalytic subunit